MSKIHYQLQQSSLPKPWILLIHGLFGSLDNLAALKRGLMEDYNILSIDLPDHGKSLRTSQFSLKNYAQLIVNLLDELEIANITIIGHSLGGKVAMQLALSYPQYLTSLVLLDIAPVTYSPHHQEVFAGLDNVELNTITSRQDANSFLQKFIKDNSTRQFLLKSLYQDKTSWQWQFNLALLKRDYPLISEGIHSQKQFLAPTLFIKGELSDYLTAEHRAAVLKLFPLSQLKVVSGTGHWLHAEKPAVCIAMIKAFMQGNNANT